MATDMTTTTNLTGSQKPSTPYDLDSDEIGIRKMTADAITGAIAFGMNGANPPPEGHWLTPFWEFGNRNAKARLLHVPATSASCAATRYRLEPTDEAPNLKHGWIYEDGDCVNQLTKSPMPGLVVERLRSERVYPRPKLEKGIATKLSGPNDKRGCFEVMLGGKRYSRRGDSYSVWFDARDRGTGLLYRKGRTITNPTTIARIDEAIASLEGYQSEAKPA